MLEETHVQTDFPRVGTFGFQIIQRILKLVTPLAWTCIPLVTRISQVSGESTTYRSPWTANLHIRNIILIHVRHQLRQYDRTTDWRIEEWFAIRVRTGKLWRPVITSGQRQEVSILITKFGRTEERLSLFAPSFLHTLRLAGTQILDSKVVSQAYRFAGECIATVSNRTTCFHCIRTYIWNRTTKVGMEWPVFTEILIDAYQEVCIQLLVLRLGDAIQTTGRTFSQLCVGRSVELLGIVIVGVVQTYASRNGQPIQNLIA